MKRRILSLPLPFSLSLSLPFFLFLLLLSPLLLVVPVHAAAVPEALSASCTQVEWDILLLTNQVRIQQGLAPLSIFPDLQSAADLRERDLAVYYSHDRPDGTSCFTALEDENIGYYAAGENIATGFTSAAGVMNGWMNSDGHRANILSDQFVHIGTGHDPRGGKYGTSSVQLFLSKRCAISNLRLSQDTLSLPRGGSLDDQNLYLTASCSDHGDNYLPLLPGMYTGFDSNTPGEQEVTVRWGGQAATLSVKISPFRDVSGEAYFGDAVTWAVDHGYIVGTGSNHFTPSRTCTRGEVVTVLWRAAGSPEPASGSIPFSDVKSTDYYANAVLWAYENGITSGVDSRRFAPGSPCTRAQVVTFLWRAQGSPVSPVPSTAPDFLDVPASAASYQAVAWAVEERITSGTDALHFSPNAPCTRGQIVTFLHRAMA